MIETGKNAPARAVLVGVNNGMTDDAFEESMEEFAALADACGLIRVGIVTQKAHGISDRTYVGSGKAEEIRDTILALEADICLMNCSLTPMQVRELERILDTEVLDRTGLILQIFADRARTREAQLQVESAQLKYMLPYLAGMRKNLSRQGGGSGRLSNKGAGEKKIELDRRLIEHRIAQLRRELEKIDRERGIQRKQRNRSGYPQVALAGYTNAGKSTLMNAFISVCAQGDTDSAESKKVFEKDMLFATLDTAVRKIEPEGRRTFLLKDTVGFVSDLPTALVSAFRSTLSEVTEADLILEVIDASDPRADAQVRVTAETLAEIGASNIPVLYVLNKCDRTADPMRYVTLPRKECVLISAKEGTNLEQLVERIGEMLEKNTVDLDLLIPYAEGGRLSEIERTGRIRSREYLPEGTRILCSLPREEAGKYLGYVLNLR